MSPLRRRVASLERTDHEHNEIAVCQMTDVQLEAVIIRGMDKLVQVYPRDNGLERLGNKLSEDRLEKIAAGL